MFLFLVFSFYFLSFFEQEKVICLPYDYKRRPELLRLIIDNIPVLYSQTLTESQVKLMLELYRENFIQAHLNNTTNYQFFSISRFMRKNNTLFPIHSPYNHYNVSLEFYKNWEWNTWMYHQLTTYKNYLAKPIDGFNFFYGTNLYLNDDPQQLISNELRFYDHSLLKCRDESGEILQQIELFKYKNQIELFKHFKKSVKI